MKTTKIEDGFVVMSNEDMTGRRLLDSPALTLIHMTVNPGGSIPAHGAPVDMEFYVLEGQGSFSIGDESIMAGPGTLIESPRNLAHGIHNPGDQPLRLLAIKNGQAR